MFHHTLFDDAIGWYHNLPLESVHTFEELESVFKVAFSHKIRKKGESITLLNVFQNKRETLQEYMAHFIVAVRASMV